MTKSATPSTPLVDTALNCVLDRLRRIRRLIVPERLHYAPLGWDTPLDASEKGWVSDSVLSAEREKWDRFVALVRGTGPLGFSADAPSLAEVNNVAFHNLNYVWGYVVLRAAFGREHVSILDWGGGLGHYYLLARTFLPDLHLDYHCKDVPSLVHAGRELVPEITWHQDDSCLRNDYDLVLVSGSLQYCREWRALLKQLRQATRRYLFLTRTPVVQQAPSFVAVQHAYGTRMLHLQFNEEELLTEIKNLGFKLEREMVTGDLIYIRNAPEDAVLKGWLFSATGCYS